MNNVVELKGKRFVQASKNGMRGGIAMNGKVEVSTEHLLRLRSQLIQIKEFWDKETKPFEGILVFIIIRLLQKVIGFLDFLKERLLMMQLLGQNLIEIRVNILSHIFLMSMT